MNEHPSLVDTLAQSNLLPLWDRYMTLLTREPAPLDWPINWSWKALQPLIARATEEVCMADAERRVLLLAHPAFAPHPYSTSNLTGALQVLQPGEHAEPHRHTVAALRFVMEGDGATTRVDGQPCEMAEGDLILTPSWSWHEHINEGDRRVIWFDGLDLPLAHHLRSVFLEFRPPHGAPERTAKERHPVGRQPTSAPSAHAPASTRVHFPRAAIAAALDELPPQADGSREFRYTNGPNGGPVLPTLDCYALRLRSQVTTRAHRSTSSAIAVVAQGSGTSWLGDKAITWEKNDIFTIPHWHWVAHRANTDDAQLFLMADRGLLDAMGYLRTEYE